MSAQFVLKTTIIFITTLILSACSMGPDYVRPEIKFEAQFKEQIASGESLANLKWVEFFSDTALQDLVHQAIANNKNLAISAARIEQARAILGFTRADQLPRIDVSGNASRTGPSDQAFGLNRGPYNAFGLFADLSYELDFWGKLSRATEAQRAELLSTEYADKAVMVSLVSDVASTYFSILGFENRLKISNATLENRKGATSVIFQRYDKGVVPELDFNQAQIEEADAAVAVSILQGDLKQAKHALTVLLGGFPTEISNGKALYDQNFSETFPSGLPAELIERRPDIRAAEELARASVERIGIAEAERLPSFDLLGFIGLQSNDHTNFFRGDAKTWSIGGSLLGPLIDFGKSESVVEAAQAEAKVALLSYEQSVIQAVREVEDALSEISSSKTAYELREKQVKAAKNAAHLSRSRYDEGVTPYLEVLDIERSLFEAELGASAQRESYLKAIVQLYKALGGGWN